MTKRNFGVLALLAVYCSFSYCDVVSGTSPNAAINSHQWVMENIIPKYTGLTVDSINYNYSLIKDTQDDVVVGIRNKINGSDGYVFESYDNWSGVPGNTIRKTVPVDNIPWYRWGDGDITVQGNGLVVDPNVRYNYRYDPCDSDPLYSPSCPGYAAAIAAKQAAEYALKLSEGDNRVDYSTPKTELPDYYKEEFDAKTNVGQDDEKKKRLGIRSAENALTQANELSQQAILDAMNFVPNFQSYYTASIEGREYIDNSFYKSTNIPENKKALRMGFAQQLKHQELVDLQYQKLQGK